MKSLGIHNLKSITPIWSIQVALVSYKYLVYSDNINYTILHNFIVRYLFNLC
jgi:hypothetical protein